MPADFQNTGKSRTRVGLAQSFSCMFASNVTFFCCVVQFHSQTSSGETCSTRMTLCPVTGGCHKMRGQHWSQLPLALAGVCCLCLWTLSEGHRVAPPQREVKQRLGHTLDFEWTGQHCVSPPRLHKSARCFGLCLHLLALSLYWWTPVPFTENGLPMLLLLPLLDWLFIVNGYVIAHVWCERIKSLFMF